MNHPLGNEFPQNFTSFLSLIESESDRGAVLVSASLLDSSLEDALKLRLLEPTDRDDLLFAGFTAPLSTFAAKIEMAFRLGIISQDTKSMLTVFRKLRNDCAHRVEFGSFEEQRMRDRLARVYEQQPEVFAAMNEQARETIERVLEEQSTEVTPTDVFADPYWVRSQFNLFFASTAAAIASLGPDIERIPTQLNNEPDG